MHSQITLSKNANPHLYELSMNILYPCTSYVLETKCPLSCTIKLVSDNLSGNLQNSFSGLNNT